MPITKRVRFEVLRRDGHTCRYCGRRAPDVELAVDHVVPEALGGGSDPSNLTAACVECNQGKASISPDSPIVADVDEDALRWKHAIERAAEIIAADLAEERAMLARFDAAWHAWTYNDGADYVPRPANWEQSVLAFRNAGLPEIQIVELVKVAMESKATPANTWRYYCGCVWNAVRRLQDTALAILEAESGGEVDEEAARRRQFEGLADT